MKTILVNHAKGQRPNIELKVQRVEATAWRDLGFYRHHYLTANINPSCKCLVFTWNGKPIAFVGLLNTPRQGIPYSMSISRCVINPDFQGLGLFHQIASFCGGIVKSLSDDAHEYRLYIKSAHRKVGDGLNNKSDWRGTVFDGKTRKETREKSGRYKNHLLRKSWCKEYIGDKIDGYQDILKPIKEMREEKMKKRYKQLELFD